MLESASGGGECDYTRTGVKEDTLGAYGTSGNILIRFANKCCFRWGSDANRVRVKRKAISLDTSCSILF